MKLSNIIMFPDLLTVKQAGEVLHLCRQSGYKYIQDGTIPAFKNPAGKYMIPRKYVEDLMLGCYNSDATKDRNCPAEGGFNRAG